MSVVRLVSLSVLASVVPLVASVQEEAAISAKTWLGREAEIEAFLEDAEVVRLEPIGIGVTSPDWMYLAPGGLFPRGVWKNIPPGIYRGFYESYKAEIAAYELDKLLRLQMVPPKVEKRVEGDLGMAMMEATNAQTVKALGGFPTPPPAQRAWWSIQLIRAKMFDNLINNRDPNEGNWMFDSAGNVILIDHSRAFTTGTDMQHPLVQVDQDLWERMLALDEAALTAALGEWLTEAEISSILERRAVMQEEIARLVAAAQNGERDVFVRYRVPPRAGPEPPADPSDAELDALAGQFVDIANAAPVVARGSELAWLGRVVRLEEYRGPHWVIANEGLDSGLTYGLLTDFAGLICLAPKRSEAAARDALAAQVGKATEILGISQDVAGAVVVDVTVVRPR